MAVPFKGFWIASEFYGNLADRESVDIDLFVKENDLEKIAVVNGKRRVQAPAWTFYHILN